jgi:serine/threonine protein kinase
VTRRAETPELKDETYERLRRAISWPDFEKTRYEVIRELARGGMGIVYEARDRELDRPVALKVLAADMSDADAALRLRREAQIMAGLEHPGIVPLHDVGLLPDGRVFYAMKLVSGARLDHLVAEGRPLGELLRVFLRILESVGFAHAHGVIHRDLKPENVMIGTFGEVLVMDWGVAKRFGEGEKGLGRVDAVIPAAGTTAHGTVLGTPAYMAPEQARGEVSRIDLRADIYALGGILYFLLTRKPPEPRHPGSLLQTRTRESGTPLHGVIPPREVNPGVPPALEAVCLKALSEDPAERYPRTQELAAEVSRFLEGGSVSAYKEGLWARARRFETRYRTPILVILAYVAMRVLLLVFARV